RVLRGGVRTNGGDGGARAESDSVGGDPGAGSCRSDHAVPGSLASFNGEPGVLRYRHERGVILAGTGAEGCLIENDRSDRHIRFPLHARRNARSRSLIRLVRGGRWKIRERERCLRRLRGRGGLSGASLITLRAVGKISGYDALVPLLDDS